MPTNFGTGFGPSFGFSGWNNQQFGNNQLTAPTKQQKFPGLSDEQIKRLESISSDPQRQQELYKQAIQQLNSQNVKDNRIATENEMAYRNLNQKDVRQKNYTDSQIRLEQLADLTKEKYGLRQDAPTQEVVNGVIAMAQDKGVSLDEMNNYLDSGDQNFLYNIGLKVHPREKLKEKWKKNTWENMVAESFAPLDSADKAQYRFFRNIWNLDTKIDDYLAEHLPKSWVDKVLGDRTLEEFHKEKADIRETNKREIDDYIKLVNDANQRHREENVDQDIADYYSGKKYSELLKEGDWDGFFYKGLGDSASNWDMPLIIGATIVNPAMGTALMGTDSYVRENQEAYENMRNNGATHEQAEAGGAVVGLINAAVEVTLDRLLGGVETTASSAIRQRLTGEITQEAAKKGLGRIILEGVGTQVRSSAEEGLEEVVQQIVQNAAVKTINDNQELFEGLDQAFEGGAFNFMNILAGGSNVVTNVDANKNYIKQNAVNTINSTKDAFSNVSQGVDTAKGKLSDVIDQTYGIDETLRKDIQDNPYSAQVWERTKNYIEENGRPEKSNEVAKALITDVADRVQESLMDKMEEGKEAGKLYQPLLDAGYSVDISELKDGIDEMLEKYGIKVEDGKLDFSKTAIDGSEANNIRKIYNWIKDTNKPMSLDEYKNRFRKTMSDMVDFNQVGRDQAGRKTADTQGDKVLKGIRSFANDLAHNQIPELAAVDKQFNEWVQIMDEVSDGLVYKDKAKRGVIRDNISQIIKNLDTPNRRELANRLEKIMPGITEEVRAINKMPQLIDHYYKPSKWQERITTGAGGIIGTTVGGPVGGVVGIGAGYWLSKQIDKLKSSKWDKIISETSEDGKAKLNDIQARIKNNEKISQEQKAFLEEMSNKLKEGKADKEAEVAKIIAEVSSAEGDVETALTNAIARLETLGAKQEVKEMRQLLGQVQNQKSEDAQMEQARQEFEAEKENIINESADQRLPEFKERIYKLQEEEKRIGSVAGKKIGKTFEGKDYKNQQETKWLRKKDKLIEEIGEFYNVDQQEASEIYDRIEKTVSMDDLGFNRKPATSKTAKYQVADQTNTPEFKKRFEGSKVVDESGKPLRVYHGTPNEFTEFSRNKIGSTSDHGLYGEGFYFSNSKGTSEGYARGGNVMELYLDIKNPLYLSDFKSIQELADYLDISPSILSDSGGIIHPAGRLASNTFTSAVGEFGKGHDGIIIDHGRGNIEYVAFEPNQIKSATDNVGTFDRDNPDIRYQKYGVAGQGEKGISAAEGLNIRNFKNGKSVKELANQYGIDTKIVDSISTPEGQRAYGMYGDRLITLSKDLKESTVPHELLHGVFDMVDGKRRTSILEGIQKKLNVDNVQAEEWLADSFSEYYRTGKFGTQGLAKTFVEKIKQFFYQIKSYIDGTYANEKQIRQLFNDIIDGKIEGEYGVYSDPKFQSVWHGSPADFERFDSTHMGEGEGAQAHGWGHYVAVDKDTGLRYGKMGARKYQGKQVGGFGNLYSELDDSKEYSVDVTNAVKEISLLADKEDISIKEAKQKALERRKGRLRDAEERLEKAKKRGIERNIEDVENIVNRTKILIDTMNKIDENDFSNRNLYEVEIPDPIKKDTPTGSNYLEEDKYYSKAEVKKFLDLMKNIDSGWLKDTKESRIYDLYKKGLDIRGKDLYDMLAYAKGDKQASKFLESLGYDGIHYFGGQDGEAYVIFNDDALEITKHHKY